MSVPEDMGEVLYSRPMPEDELYFRLKIPGKTMDAAWYATCLAWNLRQWLHECIDPSLKTVLNDVLRFLRNELESQLVDGGLAKWALQIPREESDSAAVSLIDFCERVGSVEGFLAQGHPCPPPEELRYVSLAEMRCRVLADNFAVFDGDRQLTSEECFQHLMKKPVEELARMWNGTSSEQAPSSPEGKQEAIEWSKMMSKKDAGGYLGCTHRNKAPFVNELIRIGKLRHEQHNKVTGRYAVDDFPEHVRDKIRIKPN